MGVGSLLLCNGMYVRILKNGWECEGGGGELADSELGGAQPQ